MEATDQLLKNLTLRGYPKTLAKSAMNRAAQKDRTSLLKTQEKPPTTGDKPIPFIINYNPHNPTISKSLNINKRILASSAETTYLLDKQFFLVNRQAANLRQTLVITDIRQPTTPKGSGPCQKPCTTCPYMKSSRTITCWTTKETFQIHGCFNCQSKNIIYILSCKSCGLQYVGQNNTFNERFRAHLADIRYGVMKPVSRHFITSGHSANDVLATTVMQTTGNINNRLQNGRSYDTQV